MPFFRVRTAFCGPPVIPHCKDIRFRVIAGYPDYGSSYHFYGIVRRRTQKGCFLRPFLPPVPSSACAFVAVLAVCSCFCCLFLFLLFVSVSASAVRSRFRVCFCPHHPLSLLPSASASAVRFRFCRPVSLLPSGFAFAIRSRPRRLFPLVPSASPALCRATKKPAALLWPQAFRSRRFSPLGSAIRLRARIRRCRKFCSDWD